MRQAIVPIFLLALGACDASSRPQAPPTASSPTPPATALTASAPPPVAEPTAATGSSEPEASDVPLEPTSSGELETFARSTNVFAFDLFEKLRATSGNLVFSPVFITSALTMALGGARSETAREMKRVLHVEVAPEQAMSSAGKLLASFQNPDQKVIFRVANRLFGDKTYTFDAKYSERVRRAFNAPLERLDFRAAFDRARLHINGWVSQKTENRIQDLLPDGSVNANTQLVLVNAIYFLGGWQTPFLKARTKPEPFRTLPTAEHEVATMHTFGHFAFAALDRVKVLEMHYAGGNVAMVIVLPDAIDGLAAVEKTMRAPTLGKWVKALQPTLVDVALPKFEINPSTSTPLRDHLIALGMPSAFDEAKADFTGMANPSKANPRLYLSGAFHKAFVELDEKGTEAAAASGLIGGLLGGSSHHENPSVFHADHPFLFFLRHTQSGAILFMGRVADPT